MDRRSRARACSMVYISGLVSAKCAPIHSSTAAVAPFPFDKIILAQIFNGERKRAAHARERERESYIIHTCIHSQVRARAPPKVALALLRVLSRARARGAIFNRHSGSVCVYFFFV